MTCVAPGDTIAALPASGTVRTSSAVVHRGEELCSTQAGALITREAGGADGPGASSYEVRSRHKRYTVVANDDVIGMVTGAPCHLACCLCPCQTTCWRCMPGLGAPLLVPMLALQRYLSWHRSCETTVQGQMRKSTKSTFVAAASPSCPCSPSSPLPSEIGPSWWRVTSSLRASWRPAQTWSRS